MTGSRSGGLLVYFVLTYVLAWACFVPVAITSAPAITPVHVAIVTLGAFAPAVSALWLTRRALGPEGVRSLVAGIGRWDAGARWYVFALGYLLAIKLASALV